MNPDKTEVKKVQKIAIDLYQLNKNFKLQEEQYKKQKENLQTRIKNFMFSNGCDKFNFGVKYKGKDEQFNLSVCDVKQRKVIFDIDKLKKKLDKNILKQIIIKQYSIVDYSGLVKYLKSCGVDPKIFVRYIEVHETVDEKEIDRLGDIGEISLEELKDCYEIKENVGYIRITETKVEEEKMDAD